MKYSIKTYRGYGSPSRIHIHGQLSSSEPPDEDVRDLSGDHRVRLRRRLLDAVRLAVSRRLPGETLRVSCGGRSCEAQTDSYGHFDVSMTPEALDEAASTLEYQVELIRDEESDPILGGHDIQLARPKTTRVIVSDIDDTIVHTGVANKLKMLWELFGQSAKDREMFPGTAALFRGLRAGRSGSDQNLLIYLSRSPWSIYPILEEFFSIQDFPDAPVILLREWGISWRHPLPRRARSHKADLLQQIFETFPDQRFVLIGDSGQRDPELYARFARQHPDRIEAIYIRQIGDSEKRWKELDTMRRVLGSMGVPLVLARETQDFAKDAEGRAFVSAATLEEVNSDVEQANAGGS